MIRRKATVDKNECVACGCCIKVCPMGAIRILLGSYAIVDEEKCVGCRKCFNECPASVIRMKEVKV